MAELQTNNSKTMSLALVLLTGGLYISISSGLITFNKYLMAPGMFPYPAALGLLHAIFCSLMATFLYMVKPALFTSITDPEQLVTDPEKRFSMYDCTLWKAILPIALFFSLQIVLSNQAYLFADIAFLQMLKEANVVFVYITAISFGLAAFKWVQMRLIGLIVVATWISVKGDLTFVWAGFLIQCACCVAETTKITLQSLLLSSYGAGKGLDVLSYMLLVMPLCAAIFATLLLLLSFAGPSQMLLPLPALADWIRMKWILLLNACVALALNLSTLAFIKCSSGVTFVLASILKDVMIVLAGIMFMGHQTTVLQTIGFTLQVALILLYSLTKVYPDEFEHGIIGGLRMILSGNTLETQRMKDSASVKYGATKARDDRLPVSQSCQDSKSDP